MFTIDNVTYRNIQEQVQKNKADIAAFTNIQFTLNNFGITVLGRLDSEMDIPANEYEYGDAYLIGEEEPYDIYIYTRTDVEGEGEFINMGPLTIAGPQGPQGPAGQDGADGAAATITIGTVTTGAAGTNVSVTNSGTSTAAVLNFTIPRGAKGDTGATGAQGERGLTGLTGATGPQGPQGDPGQSFVIMGNITSTSQLPDPSTSPRNEAYVYSDGDASTYDRLYYITGTTGSEVWSYCSFAAAGTTVTVGGSAVSSFNADTKQDALVSGTNIKTVNSTSLLGSGDVAVQPTLVSGTNIKTINNQSILGSGDLTVTASVDNQLFYLDLRNVTPTDYGTYVIYTSNIDDTQYSKFLNNEYGVINIRFSDVIVDLPTTHPYGAFLSGEAAYFYRTTWPSDRRVSGKITTDEYSVQVKGSSGSYYLEIRVDSYEEGYVKSVNNQTGAITINNTTLGALPATMCTYQTTAPSAAITDGGVHIVYLSAEPATKYSGYIYLIDEA